MIQRPKTTPSGLKEEDHKKLVIELTKYAEEGASDSELKQFRETFISQKKKSIQEQKSPSESNIPQKQKKFALESSSEDGSLVSQKSPKPNMPVLTQEGFEQAMSKKKAVPTDMSGKALMPKTEERKPKKVKESSLWDDAIDFAKDLFSDSEEDSNGKLVYYEQTPIKEQQEKFKKDSKDAMNAVGKFEFLKDYKPEDRALFVSKLVPKTNYTEKKYNQETNVYEVKPKRDAVDYVKSNINPKDFKTKEQMDKAINLNIKKLASQDSAFEFEQSLAKAKATPLIKQKALEIQKKYELTNPEEVAKATKELQNYAMKTTNDFLINSEGFQRLNKQFLEIENEATQELTKSFGREQDWFLSGIDFSKNVASAAKEQGVVGKVLGEGLESAAVLAEGVGLGAENLIQSTKESLVSANHNSIKNLNDVYSNIKDKPDNEPIDRAFANEWDGKRLRTYDPKEQDVPKTYGEAKARLKKYLSKTNNLVNERVQDIENRKEYIGLFNQADLKDGVQLKDIFQLVGEQVPNMALTTTGVVTGNPYIIGLSAANMFTQTYGPQYYGAIETGLKEDLGREPSKEEIAEAIGEGKYADRGEAAAWAALSAATEYAGELNVIKNTGKALGFGDDAKNVIGSLFRGEIKNFGKSALNNAKNISSSALGEYLTESMQTAIEQVSLGTQVRDDATKYLNLKEINEAGIKGALIGGVFPFAGSVARQTGVELMESAKKVATAFDLSNKNVNNLVQVDSFFKSAVDNVEERFKLGEITEEQRQNEIDSIGAIRNSGTKIPSTFSEEAKKKSLDLILEKTNIEKEIEGKDAALVVKQKNRIAEINNELTKLSETDAIQEQSTTEVPVQSETITSETLETGVSQPGPEVVTEQATQEVTPSETITTAQEIKSGQKLFDVLNRPAVLESFGGTKLETPLDGDIYQEGQRVIFEDKNKKTYDLGNIDEISDTTVEDLGIKPQRELMTLTPEGKVKIGDNTWNIQSELPTKGIDYNDDGSVKAVSLKDDTGKTIMYEGQIAEDIAYQTLLKEFQTEEQIQAINEILEKDEELNKQLREAEEVITETAGEITEPSPTEVTTTEATASDVDKIKSDIEASKERLKKAWDKYKTMGIAFDPKSNLAKDRELVKALVEYAYNNIRLGSYTASKLIEDLTSQGFEMTRDGAKFIMDRASRKVQRDIDKTIGIKPKASEQKRINKAYSIGVATQKVATKEAKSEVKDLKGQVVDVFRAGIEAVKIAETTAKEKARDIKNKAQELAKYLDELKGAGKITANQATAMVKRFSKVNVLSEKSVNRFIDYATKVLNDADYNSKLTEARKTLSSLKKLSKDTEKNADLRVVASEFVKIDPSMVENIEEYNDIANKLKTALEGSKIRKANTKIVDTVNIDDVNTYVEKILTNQEAKIREEKIEELQSLFGVDAKEFSAEEIDALLESDEDIADDDAKIVRATLNKAFDVYSTVIDEMLSTGVDPFTGEDVEFTSSQKKIIKDFMDIDLDTVTDNKEALRIIDSLINFIQNKSTAGMLKPIADFQAIVGGDELIRQKIEGKGIRKFWFSSVGKTLAEQFTSLNLLFEKEFKGFNAASKVRKMMGITDLVNGKSIGQSEANRIVKKYVEQFYNKTANGEAFNSAYNDIERGVFAHVYRSVIGTEQRKKAVFEKRKQEVLDAIAILEKNGNKEEKQLAELYKKAYDKILDGSENINDVQQKTDSVNVDGVNYWVNQWTDKFDALSDLALNFYNKILNRDLGFTPDRFKRLQRETKEIDLENDESAFISNTDKVLYNKKSGSLMDKQEDRKTPKGMFIDLSFDSKNSNSMYDALIDLNTAFNIRKVQSFLNSDNFNKIFKDDADLFKKRIASYVRLSRRKSPYTGSELSGLIQKLDKIATIGVTQALASPTQPFKQIIPVMASTAINAGSLGMGSAFNPSYNNWLNKLGYAISNRGIESRAEIEAIDRLLEKAASSKKEKVVGLVREANEKMLKWTLVNPDVWIARASFKAYYEQYLKKEGLYNDIPKKQRFGVTEIDYDNHEPNEDAADYAQEMIDRQQNISDYDLAGDLFTDKNSITKAFIKMLMAFSSFRMNQGSRLGADLTTLEYWNTSTNEDKLIALRSIAGYTAEQAVFRGLQITFGMMFYYAAKSLMGRGDDEEEDKKFKNNLIKASSTGAITDTFSPLPLLDPYVQNLSASSVDAIQDIVNIPEKDKIKLFEANKQEAIKALGVYGIVPERAGQIWDLGKLAYTRKFKDNYGREKEISQKDADALKVLIGPYLAASVTGVLAPDISSLVRKSIKIAEKGAKKGSVTRRVMSQEEYDRLTK